MRSDTWRSCPFDEFPTAHRSRWSLSFLSFHGFDRHRRDDTTHYPQLSQEPNLFRDANFADLAAPVSGISVSGYRQIQQTAGKIFRHFCGLRFGLDVFVRQALSYPMVIREWIYGRIQFLAQGVFICFASLELLSRCPQSKNYRKTDKSAQVIPGLMILLFFLTCAAIRNMFTFNTCIIDTCIKGVAGFCSGMDHVFSASFYFTLPLMSIRGQRSSPANLFYKCCTFKVESAKSLNH